MWDVTEENTVCTQRPWCRTCGQLSGTRVAARGGPYLEHEALAARGVQHGLQREVAQARVVGPALGHLREDAADALGGRS